MGKNHLLPHHWLPSNVASQQKRRQDELRADSRHQACTRCHDERPAPSDRARPVPPQQKHSYLRHYPEQLAELHRLVPDGAGAHPRHRQPFHFRGRQLLDRYLNTESQLLEGSKLRAMVGWIHGGLNFAVASKDDLVVATAVVAVHHNARHSSRSNNSFTT